MAMFQIGLVTTAIWCLLIFAWVPLSAARTSSCVQIDGGSDGHVSDGGRHLQQITNQCPHQFAYDNFTILFSNCPSPSNTSSNDDSYPKAQCCTDGLGGMLCPYKDLVNDVEHNNCAATFWSILQTFENYTVQPQQFFMTICTNLSISANGVPCPNGTASAESPTSNYSSPLGRFGITILGLLMAFEVLVLCV